VKTGSWLIFALLSPLLCHAAEGRALVRLCERAGVAGETIRLSDFLPPENSAAIRDQAAAIELGRTPLLGSTRYFLREEVEQALREHRGLLEQISIPERIVVFRTGWAISTDLVRHAISDFLAAGNLGAVWFVPSQLKVIGEPAATRNGPELKVKSVEQDKLRGEIRFVISCAQRKECGMFLATMPEPKDFSASLRDRPRSSAILPKISHQEILVRAGKPVMLSMHDGSINISLRVICLDRGSLGQTIRVRDAAGTRIFHARVVGASAVQANL
jgi:hypothetical protein